VIKYGVILSPDLFTYLEEHASSLVHRHRDLLGVVVHSCAQLKALVVAEDETESDYRAILNFGHTLGHAVEALTEYRSFVHGEAIAIGMAFAARLSVLRGWLDAKLAQRIIRLIDRFSLPTEIPDDLSRSALALAMEADKKRSGGKIKFVCVEDLGRTRFEFLSTEDLQKALEEA
jgi:3-dehydroquinate synthase